jgi:hypothetical protein
MAHDVYKKSEPVSQVNVFAKKTAVIIFILALLGSVFYLRAVREFDRDKNGYSNFFVFWLSGNLITHGESPYNPEAWSEGHRLNGYGEPAESIFLYPLPLAVFLTPLGLFTFAQAFVGWKILSQVLIAVTIFILLSRWQTPAHQRLFIPMVLSLLYFGPVLLTLRTGSIGPFTLLIVCVAILMLEKDRSLFAGLLLSLTMFKPPQGLVILLLVGIWSLARRDWKIIQGVVLGGIILWVIGASIDLNWVSKFLHGGAAAFDRRLGFHSNVWSFSYLICSKNMFCTYAFGGAGASTLLGLSGFYLWKKQAQITAWDALNLIIPIGFVSTVYLWAYDQILYIIPIIWVVGVLVQKTKSYIHAFLFLIILVFYAFFAVGKLSETSHDLWSLGNTLIVFIGLFIANKIKQKQ